MSFPIKQSQKSPRNLPIRVKEVQISRKFLTDFWLIRDHKLFRFLKIQRQIKNCQEDRKCNYFNLSRLYSFVHHYCHPCRGLSNISKAFWKDYELWCFRNGYWCRKGYFNLKRVKIRPEPWPRVPYTHARRLHARCRTARTTTSCQALVARLIIVRFKLYFYGISKHLFSHYHPKNLFFWTGTSERSANQLYMALFWTQLVQSDGLYRE